MKKNNQNNSFDFCEGLHDIFNNIPHSDFQTIKNMPSSKKGKGIYIMFEKGEMYKGKPRIVRVGTHGINEDNERLYDRLKYHYKGTKDVSIMRKNIGIALLNKENNPYSDIWRKDTYNKENKKYVKREEQKYIEKRVSEYIQTKITFVIINIETLQERKRYEEAIIVSLVANKDFKSSDQWLGKYHHENIISDNGMWLKQGHIAEPLTLEEFNIIKTKVQKI
jgi:hypothetical protein